VQVPEVKRPRGIFFVGIRPFMGPRNEAFFLSLEQGEVYILPQRTLGKI